MVVCSWSIFRVWLRKCWNGK